ncbi:hypothetical protein PV341_39645 [Streptomyces sp. PA03-1a]|nr:hypothetical protein [Streptomyces sp. PA03-1a]MDX2814258.1 hypothetical protein [Streptomyces sp. PA03-5A]
MELSPTAPDRLANGCLGALPAAGRDLLPGVLHTRVIALERKEFALGR